MGMLFEDSQLKKKVIYLTLDTMEYFDIYVEYEKVVDEAINVD